jgi:hypothetical protein
MRELGYSREGTREKWARGERWINELCWRVNDCVPTLDDQFPSTASYVTGAVLGDGHVGKKKSVTSIEVQASRFFSSEKSPAFGLQ